MILTGKVTGINTSDGIYNLQVTDKKGEITNLKIAPENAEGIAIGGVFEFAYEVTVGERVTNTITSFEKVENFPFEKQNEALRDFYPSAPLEEADAEAEVNRYIDMIGNENIRAICRYLIDKYHDPFFIYPAASKLHHAYVGGLAYHSVGMLHLASSIIENYPYLDKDYLYSGVMLHDIGKTKELSGPVDTTYTLDGQLLGHLVLGAMEIRDAARVLNLENTKEVLLLEHMLISHHGQPQFGSAKRPMTAEALALWYIDTIDSKFRVLGEELEHTETDNYTTPVGVLDKMKIYKP